MARGLAISWWWHISFVFPGFLLKNENMKEMKMGDFEIDHNDRCWFSIC